MLPALRRKTHCYGRAAGGRGAYSVSHSQCRQRRGLFQMSPSCTGAPVHSCGHRGRATRWPSPPAAPADTETEELTADGNIPTAGGTQFFAQKPWVPLGNTAGRLNRRVSKPPVNVKYVTDTVFNTPSTLSHLTLSRPSVGRFHCYPDL